ncbi:N-acetylglucosamine-specific PTS transporter subunit IIBC [Sphingomonas sp.]|uniref:N-acetylglucosamine-specific PTS transporter subunit IIBC n=1 Tax=Sphingomonas sp. TaxID=28214 RepID=UPI002DB6EF0C|nr:N-acetylglucosamine-specific PTS transporter subunit IIBC [Sphingomonas sp.]HEU4967870.1 N-acetylglucosamine-specific PTS transporter subunit IIBC [Sphingomonas sp.]
MKSILARLQPLGRALMLPIAVLPVAGLLLRLGQPDLLDIPFVAAAGNAIFGHLGLLFAIGVGVGLARENHGAAGLAGAVAYFVTVDGAKTLLAVPPEIGAGLADASVRDTVIAAWRDTQLARLSVPAGILSGIAGGLLYNRYSAIKLPDFLAFFGGRRFVPIAAGFVGIGLALVFGYGFPLLSTGIDTLSRWVVGAGPLGLFLYGVLNRLLIVTGLHHILNNIAWFIIGDFHGATGDLKRFFAGDPSAGAFMTGFFPVMMFGLPAACLAMYRTALPERRKAVGGLLLSLALTSFLTGVTEPIEFSFMFLAPLLYAVHAVLTGLSMALMNWLGVHLGFGFSAGLFDYVLGFGLATRPLLLLPVGAAYALVYYASFSWCIRRFDLKTPGREPLEQAASTPVSGTRGEQFVAALGGRANLVEIDACTTRLRLRLADPARIDEPALKALGSRGLFRPGADALQVVLGPVADQVATEIRQAARQGLDIEAVAALLAPLRPRSAVAKDSRVVVQAEEAPPANLGAHLEGLGIRAAAVSGDHIHLIVGAEAPALAQRLAG